MLQVIGAEEERQRILERRARREARRERQRAANIGRAKRMHEARMAYERELPDTDASAGKAVAPEQQGGLLEIHVGCSGCFYWHWRDQFYPPRIPSNRWFEHYATQFRTVELNAPFYSWPTVATVKGWVRQAGQRRFVCYHYTPTRLKTILAQLDPSRRNVVEFRHKSWWDEQVFGDFREAKVAFCSSSGPRLPDTLVQTADDVYVRFHGKTRWYRHDYTKDELAVWVQRIRESGAKRVWAYFNNDRECYAIKNARELLRQLKRSGEH